MTEAMGFAHINLNEVDPQGKSPAEGEVLQFVVTKAAKSEWSNDNGSGECLDFTFTVTNSDSFSGRNFYTRMFPDKEGGKNPTARRLRILRDATGVSQTGDVEALCEALVNQRAEFKAPVQLGRQREGGPAPKMEVNLWKAEPIS